MTNSKNHSNGTVTKYRKFFIVEYSCDNNSSLPDIKVDGSADEPSYGAGTPVPEKMNKYQ
jgi:hypothetical protein